MDLIVYTVIDNTLNAEDKKLQSFFEFTGIVSDRIIRYVFIVIIGEILLNLFILFNFITCSVLFPCSLCVFFKLKNRDNYATVPGDDHQSDSDDGSSVDPDPALSTRSFASVSSFFGSEVGCPPSSLPDSELDIRGHSLATAGFDGLYDESDDVPTLSLSSDIRLTDVWTVYEEKISETNLATDATISSVHKQPTTVGSISEVDGTVSSEIIHKENVGVSSSTDAHNSNSLSDENENSGDVLFEEPVDKEKLESEQIEYSNWTRKENKDFEEENVEILSSCANSAAIESVLPIDDDSSREISGATFEPVDYQSTGTLSDHHQWLQLTSQEVTEPRAVFKQLLDLNDFNNDSTYKSDTIQHEVDSTLVQVCSSCCVYFWAVTVSFIIC